MNQSQNQELQYNIIDFPIPKKSTKVFLDLVGDLGLSKRLEEKVRAVDFQLSEKASDTSFQINKDDEHELATEVLLCRHKFTCLLMNNQLFRQAAISVIQNIYTTKERKIFFDNQGCSTEQERQQALMLFTQNSSKPLIPLSKTLQHHILARIWYRILYKGENQKFQQDAIFIKLNDVIARLNALRNIYVLLNSNLIYQTTKTLNATYKKSITTDDARQIGAFGVARAAYRYHHSGGTRFSTYALFWIKREVQIQALQGRMIRIAPSLLEKISLHARNKDEVKENEAVHTLLATNVALDNQIDIHQNSENAQQESPDKMFEKKELKEVLLSSVNSVLSGKSRDIIKRKYGLDEYEGNPQSTIAIGQSYGVTRGSIYQLEKKALQKLQKHLHYTYSHL